MRQEKAPAGRAGGREGPDLRGDEEAWIGRPTGEDRPDLGVWRRSTLRDRRSVSVVADLYGRPERALGPRRDDRRGLGRPKRQAAAVHPALLRAAHQNGGWI